MRVPLTDEQRAALGKQRPPSKASLREMPEVDISKAEIVGRGPEGLRAVLAHVRAKRCRPKKGEVAAGSSPRSVRLRDVEWAALEALASKRHTTLHALLRKAARRELAEDGAQPEPAASPAKARKRKAG